MTNRILVVDDSSSVRKMVESALRYKGYNVVAVADGVQALESLERDQFDLVIMDINMPRMDGLSALKTVRERPEWASLPTMPKKPPMPYIVPRPTCSLNQSPTAARSIPAP